MNVGARVLSDQLSYGGEGWGCDRLFTGLPRSQTSGSLSTGLGFWVFTLRLQLTLAGSRGCLLGD